MSPFLGRPHHIYRLPLAQRRRESHQLRPGEGNRILSQLGLPHARASQLQSCSASPLHIPVTLSSPAPKGMEGIAMAVWISDLVVVISLMVYVIIWEKRKGGNWKEGVGGSRLRARRRGVEVANETKRALRGGELPPGGVQQGGVRPWLGTYANVHVWVLCDRTAVFGGGVGAMAFMVGMVFGGCWCGLFGGVVLSLVFFFGVFARLIEAGGR